MIKKRLRKIFDYVLQKISRFIFLITPVEFREKKNINLVTVIEEKNYQDTYEHFKEIFKKTSLFRDNWIIREHAVQKALSNDKKKEYFYLEFGVYKGSTANFFSKYVKKLYAFDSFQGLKDEWPGRAKKGHFNLNKRIPKLNSNVEPTVGLVENTLEVFLKKHNPKINFVHFDMDTYLSTKYALEKLKPFLIKDAIIIFDELYNYLGWENGEYKALKEVFKDDEYIFMAFNISGQQASIQIK